MKDEFNYWKDIAMNAIRRFYNTECELQSMAREEDPGAVAVNIVTSLCGITEDELQCIRDNDADGAYAQYCENNPPLHDYKVSFSFPAISGTVHVKAKDEDEAEEIVGYNMCTTLDSMPCYMSDESAVIDDIEVDDFGCGDDCTVDDVEDYGEYEEE